MIYGEPPHCFSLSQKDRLLKRVLWKINGTFVLIQEHHSWKGFLCLAVQGSKPQHVGHHPQCLLKGSSSPPRYFVLIFFSNICLWFENNPLIDQKKSFTAFQELCLSFPMYIFPPLFILVRYYFDVQIFWHFNVGYNQQRHCNSLGSSQCGDVKSQEREEYQFFCTFSLPAKLAIGCEL